MRGPLALVLVVVLLAGCAVLVRATLFRPNTITAYFSTATGIYPGDDVRVAGVKVGTIGGIEPVGAHARVTMHVDRDVPIPADAQAVIVALNLVAARYVQLTPAYLETGPTMPDGAVIPADRTAVPVEWDEVKEQVMRLATELGPDGAVSDTSVGRFIDSAADAMGGNGVKLRETLRQLSGAGRILAEGSGDLADIIKALHTFISTLRDSNTQIVQFQDRLATLSAVLDGSRSDLDLALRNISEVIGEVTRFVRGTREQTVEQVQRLSNVTQTLVDNRRNLEEVLHVAPTAYANAYNMFDPRTGAASGVFTLNNFADPVKFICGQIGALENVTAAATNDLCTKTLGPGLRSMSFNYLPFPFNPLLTAQPAPHQLIYTEPHLVDGAPTTSAPTPAVSAYTGVGDVPPPPGMGPPAQLPDVLLPVGPAEPLPAEQKPGGALAGGPPS
ncbi:MCE family protein [[Mycobacterium] wendilense]|uniref:MCE family protein n=1 Tax=[Mycobacterium] wendilense TaxID=3064284 RepID=A0ABN9PBX3_9MYCO|nr:MCE family protein [Mycolicibacterium sp. MU0050]CAJ1586966.1 MCE family protein [Mycolicibacterium sp. MU0050]